jgi:hypothetical protein
MLLSDILTEKSLHAEIGYLIFVWEGGPYIDILARNGIDGKVSYTDRCVNVWDYEKGCARISGGSEFVDTCLDFLRTESECR